MSSWKPILYGGREGGTPQKREKHLEYLPSRHSPPHSLPPGASRHAHQDLARPQIRELVSLGLDGERPVGGPQVDERLHRLEVVGLQQIERGGRQQEMAKTAVELLLQAQVVKRVHKVRVVQMRVGAQHLQENGLADGREFLGEAAAPAEPLPVAAAAAAAAGGEIRGTGTRKCWVGGVGYAGWVGREDVGVVCFAGDPSLHERQVLVRRQLDGLVPAVQPGVGVIPGGCERQPGLGQGNKKRKENSSTHGPALILGHVVGLQILVPPSSLSYTTRTKCHKLR